MIEKMISVLTFSNLLTVVAGACYANEAVVSLPQMNINPDKIGITGISSGAYMSIQAQLTFPEIFKRAAMVAGGPYACGESVDMAGSQGGDVVSCMNDSYSEDQATAKMSDDNIANWARLASSRAMYVWKADTLRAVSRLKTLQTDGKAYFLHGKSDITVLPVVAEAARKVYEQLTINTIPAGPFNIKQEPLDMTLVDDGERNFAHTFPTNQPRDATCDTSEFPYIGHCGIDGAKLIFSNLWGDIGKTSGESTGQLLNYDQAAISSQREAQMDEAGFVYVPRACQEGKLCGILVVLHGCNQSANSEDPFGYDKQPVGDRFATDTGFNPWADLYDMIVVYPQVKPDSSGDVTKSNFNGCWDWWGYTGKDFDQRNALQINYIVNTVKALGYKRP